MNVILLYIDIWYNLACVNIYVYLDSMYVCMYVCMYVLSRYTYHWFGKAKGVNPDSKSRRGTTLISNPGGPSSLALSGYWPRKREL